MKRSWRNSSRWLLLVSMALNLFFIGVAVAMAVREPPPPLLDRDVFLRIQQLAATLPPADADLLRAQIQNHRNIIENTQTIYHAAQDEIHETLRQNPFAVEAMRAAMAKTRAARQNFDLVIQGVIAAAADKMSSAGRHALADRPPRS
jgi:uncharacterized membrane protein